MEWETGQKLLEISDSAGMLSKTYLRMFAERMSLGKEELVALWWVKAEKIGWRVLLEGLAVAGWKDTSFMWGEVVDTVWMEGRTENAGAVSLQFQWGRGWDHLWGEKSLEQRKRLGAVRVWESVKYKSTRGLLGRGSSSKVGEREFVAEPSSQVN